MVGALHHMGGELIQGVKEEIAVIELSHRLQHIRQPPLSSKVVILCALYHQRPGGDEACYVLYVEVEIEGRNVVAGAVCSKFQEGILESIEISADGG